MSLIKKHLLKGRLWGCDETGNRTRFENEGLATYGFESRHPHDPPFSKVFFVPNIYHITIDRINMWIKTAVRRFL